MCSRCMGSRFSSFQRQGVQIGPDGSPRGLNILQWPYLDYSARFGELTIPQVDD